ncbi:MAG: hypothetical protein CMB77_06175 [Euryarchaeota archaeon]|nr:hypothetical protein [Euryarchaeota archaeon]
MEDITANRFLVTGGTGSIGSQVVRSLLDRGAVHVTIFSRDDSKHFYLQQELGPRSNVRYIIGDVRDRESLSRAFEGGIDIVVHAAALKHVLISEQNPTEAVKTNIIGTQNVVDLAKQFGVKMMVTISTDKAVNPSSTMGASKYIAEKLTLDGNSTGETIFTCVRFGNVLGSRGSVIPSMILSAMTKNMIWISDERVTRFAMPIPEAAELILDSLRLTRGGETFVLSMKAFQLGELAAVVRNELGDDDTIGLEVRGVIRAEKLHEDLLTSDEAQRAFILGQHIILAPGSDDQWEPPAGAEAFGDRRLRSDEAPRFADSELRSFIREAVTTMTSSVTNT